jgi:hypothetical protein
VVLFAFSAQALASSAIARVNFTARASNRQRSGGINQRPSEQLAPFQSLNRHGAATRKNDVERDSAFENEIEGVGFSALLKDELTGVEADV